MASGSADAGRRLASLSTAALTTGCPLHAFRNMRRGSEPSVEPCEHCARLLGALGARRERELAPAATTEPAAPSAVLRANGTEPGTEQRHKIPPTFIKALTQQFDTRHADEERAQQDAPPPQQLPSDCIAVDMSRAGKLASRKLKTFGCQPISEKENGLDLTASQLPTVGLAGHFAYAPSQLGDEFAAPAQAGKCSARLRSEHLEGASASASAVTCSRVSTVPARGAIDGSTASIEEQATGADDNCCSRSSSPMTYRFRQVLVRNDLENDNYDDDDPPHDVDSTPSTTLSKPRGTEFVFRVNDSNNNCDDCDDASRVVSRL